MFYTDFTVLTVYISKFLHQQMGTVAQLKFILGKTATSVNILGYLH